MQDILKHRMQTMRDFDSNDLLAALGLERKSSTFDALMRATGLVAAGMLLGTGLALLFAPRSGREIRKQLRESATNMSERVGAKANELITSARESLPLELPRSEDSNASSSNNGTRGKPSDQRAGAGMPQKS